MLLFPAEKSAGRGRQTVSANTLATRRPCRCGVSLVGTFDRVFRPMSEVREGRLCRQCKSCPRAPCAPSMSGFPHECSIQVNSPFVRLRRLKSSLSLQEIAGAATTRKPPAPDHQQRSCEMADGDIAVIGGRGKKGCRETEVVRGRSNPALECHLPMSVESLDSKQAFSTRCCMVLILSRRSWRSLHVPQFL